MTIDKVIAAATAALVLLAAPAAALTVKNADKKEHRLSVATLDGTQEYPIKPGQSLQVPCALECTLGLSTTDEEWDVKAGDQVEITSKGIEKLAR